MMATSSLSSPSLLTFGPHLQLQPLHHLLSLAQHHHHHRHHHHHLQCRSGSLELYHLLRHHACLVGQRRLVQSF